MRTMKITAVFFCVLVLGIPAFSQEGSASVQPVIQLAILLDTSNSMDGLIDQAKSQLWKIVAETGKARRNGMAPRIEVALYEYGNNSLSAMSGYVRQVVSFTRDLDILSEKLFELETNGGSEHCGQAIRKANDQLQ